MLVFLYGMCTHKGNFTHVHATTVHVGIRRITPLIPNLERRYGYVARFTSWLQYHWERTRYPFYSRLRGPQRWRGCFGSEKNPLPQPRFETDIFHTVTQSINRPRCLGAPVKYEEPQLSSKFADPLHHNRGPR